MIKDRSVPDVLRLGLVAVMVVGVFLRFYHLGFESFWEDEAYSLLFAKGRLVDDLQPPLYFWLSKVWMHFFGDSEFGARSLSAVIGSLALPVFYQLGKTFFNRQTGFIATTLAALSVFQITYSQELRVYSLMVLLSGLSYLFFARWRLFGGGRRDLILYWVSSVGLLYTHSFGALVIASQSVYFLLDLRLNRRKDPVKEMFRWACIQGLLGVVYIPWFLHLHQSAEVLKSGNFWIPKPDLKALFQLLSEYTMGFRLMAVFAAVIVWALIHSARRGGLDRALLFLTWFVVMIAVPFTVSLFWTSVFLPRYLISAITPLYLLTAFGISCIPWPKLKWAVFAIALYVFVSGVVLHFGEIRKEQWREAASTIDAEAKKGDLLVFHTGPIRYVFGVYSKREDLVIDEYPRLRYKGELLYDQESTYLVPERMSDLTAQVKAHDRVWVIISEYRDPGELMAHELEKNYRLVRMRNYVKVRWYLFERKAVLP